MSNPSIRALSLRGCFQTAALLVLSLVFAAHAPAVALENEPPLPPTGAAPVNTETNSIELLRSYLQLQEQLHTLQISMEENQKAAAVAATRNAISVSERLQALEQTLAAERARSLEAVRSSNRVLLIVAITFGVVCLLAMVLMAYQWRTVSRLSVAGLPATPLLGAGSGLAGGETRLLGVGGAVEQSNERLLDAISRLEKRILDFEITPPAPLTLPGPEGNHAPNLSSTILESASPAVGSSTGSNGTRVAMLLGKGQSLLNLDHPEEALDCFDQVLALEPTHTDALLRKAMALERLRKLGEAIECYDRAIAADNSFTLAYLYKGGLFNRMERFGEALECYEQALRVQEKR